MSEETHPPRLVPTSTPPEGSAAADRDLAELRREVIESRNLVIKADNLLKNLHAELKQMGRKQEAFENRHWMTGVAAYVLFAVLAAGGAFGIHHSEMRVVREEAAQNDAKVKQLSQDLEKMSRLEAARREASEKALRIFELLGSEKEGPGLNQAMSQAMRLDRQLLSPLEARAIEDRAAGMKARVAQAALERGSSAFRRQDWRMASQELGRYVELVPKVEDPLVWFHLGNARTQLKDYAGAIQPLESFLRAVGGTKTAQYAGFLLGSAYEETGNTTRAREVYERAVGLYPGSEFAPMIRARLKRVTQAEAGPQPPAPARPAQAPPPAQPPTNPPTPR